MPIVEIVAAVVSLVAVFVAWRALGEVKKMNSQLDRMQTTLYETRQEQRAAQEQQQNRIAALDVEVQKATGNLRFDPAMPLTMLFKREPRAENVLAAYHIGGCASCAVDLNSTLGEAVRERGANLNTILTALNALPENGGAANLRMPNVKFEI